MALVFNNNNYWRFWSGRLRGQLWPWCLFPPSAAGVSRCRAVDPYLMRGVINVGCLMLESTQAPVHSELVPFDETHVPIMSCIFDILLHTYSTCFLSLWLDWLNGKLRCRVADDPKAFLSFPSLARHKSTRAE